MKKAVIKRLRLFLLSILVFFLLACATSYKQTISQWRSYEDVANWMEFNLKYDFARYNEILRGRESVAPRSPSQTFALKTGVCTDGAYFAKEILNRINPKYEAKVVFIEVSKTPGSNHYVCSFKKEDGKLYIMDYATAYRSMRGTHGPFDSLQDYKDYYERMHPKNKQTIAVRFIEW
jgi:hypothetical protein